MLQSLFVHIMYFRSSMASYEGTHLNGAPNRSEYRFRYFPQEKPGPSADRFGHTRRNHGEGGGGGTQ